MNYGVSNFRGDTNGYKVTGKMRSDANKAELFPRFVRINIK